MTTKNLDSAVDRGERSYSRTGAECISSVMNCHEGKRLLAYRANTLFFEFWSNLTIKKEELETENIFLKVLHGPGLQQVEDKKHNIKHLIFPIVFHKNPGLVCSRDLRC